MISVLEVDYSTTPEAVVKGRAIIDRLRAEYPAGNFYCICDCYNSSLTKEHAEVWQNFELIKIIFPDQSKVVFRADYCPVCGKKLPTADGGRHSNKMKLI